MSKEFEHLKMALADANNENDALEALDAYSRKLSDDELEAVIGGAGLYTEENCPGQVSNECNRCSKAKSGKNGYLLFCPVTNTGWGTCK